MGCARPAGLLLAAGLGRRFGGNKLEAEFQGRMLGLYAADALAEICTDRFAVCALTSPDLIAALEARGYHIILNPAPEKGMGHSIALGIAAARAVALGGVLITLADMPFVPAAHLAKLCDQGKEQVACSTDGAVRLSPAFFPPTRFGQLASLSGDTGARKLLAEAIAVHADAALLADIDRPEQLLR